MNIPFVDLKTQYAGLKESIDSRIHQVLDHGMYIMGPEVKELEADLSKYLGVKHSIACSSGTDAAVLAMMAADIGPGDEVITTAFSFIATAETIVLMGATPVYVDIEPDTFNIDIAKVKQAITDKTKAIVPVGLYGQPADMDELNSIAKDHNLIVIEDAAQSFGANYKDKKSCALSDIGCTSFFPAKPLGCYGDGGAVFTDDDTLAERLRQHLNHGQTERYTHTRMGINGRLDSIQCAVLIEKLKKYDWELGERQRVANRYTEGFSSLSNVTTPIIRNDRATVWAQYTLRVPNRDGFREKMTELNVPTAVHYPKTMPDQPYYKEIGRCHDISEARRAANEVVSLPMHPYLSTEHQDFVIDAVEKSL